MKKLETVVNIDKSVYGYAVYCPGCNQVHVIATSGHIAWTFNNDMEKPAFQPSLMVNRDLSNPTAPRCHSYITEGKFQYLDDCTHALANQTIEIPEFHYPDDET